MGYADGLLTSGERIIHREKQHWWVFVWGAKFTILAVIAALLIIFISNGMDSTGFLGTVKTVLGWVAAAVFFSALSYVAAAMALLGFVPERVPFPRTVAAQVAGS